MFRATFYVPLSGQALAILLDALTALNVDWLTRNPALLESMLAVSVTYKSVMNNGSQFRK